MGLNGWSIVRRKAAIEHELPGAEQVAIFDGEKSELVVLNQIGAWVWRSLDGERTLRDLAQEIAVEVPASPAEDEVLKLIVDFVGNLVQRDLVVIVEQ